MKTLFLSVDLWDMVETGYEELADGVTLNEARKKELKEARQRNASALEFENIKMKENENMKEYSNRFTKLVNQMKTYGEEIFDKKIVEKLLITLPAKFDPVVTIIEETKDISNLMLDQKIMKTNHKVMSKRGRCQVEVEDLVKEEENEEIQEAEVEATLRENLMKKGYLKGVKSIKGAAMLKKIVGLKGSHNATIARNLDQSLLTIGQLVENGYLFHFEGNYCTIYDKGNQKVILARLKMKNRNFLLNFKHSSGKAFKVDVTGMDRQLTVGRTLVLHNKMGYRRGRIKRLEWEKPSVKHLRVFGCVCYAQVLKEKRYKLDETSEKCIFVGYSSQSKGYKLYSLKSKKVIISRDVLFDKNTFWN
ncbi:hypothetical protein EZV62_005488 [Acer yangbiense]|uniref:Retroviral polymerase SH3-like domain-containing protein n=1 Tax=Acer yangbiense TaxID=1000413 RepID=A0A5C7IMH6_9ROSI|nr:hypothetical protein EZV62_005488 [Acer yangbiense]